MNDKRLIKALIVSGSIATGFALNSTGAMAAELDDAAVNNNVADNGEQDVVNEKVQALNDAADVVEGDAVAAESYLYTAQESIDNNLMTEDKAAEILNGSTAVMAQAKEKNDTVQAEYATAVADETAAKEEYEKQLKDSKLEAITARLNKSEAAVEEAKFFLAMDEDPEYKQAFYESEEARILGELNEILEGIRKQYEAGNMSEEDYNMLAAGANNDYGSSLNGLYAFFFDYWDEIMIRYTDTINQYDALMARKEAAEEMVAPAKKDYEEKLAVEGAMQTAAERSQQAYDRTVAAYTETINLLGSQNQEQTEETVLSEDVYTVFNNVKAIVMENPELLQKVYALYNNEKAVDAAKYAYNYVVANVDISTINAYAKQIAGMNITPEVVNTYLDMFTNWINK